MDDPHPHQHGDYRQRCPECDKILSIVARYCSRCGFQLRGDHD